MCVCMCQRVICALAHTHPSCVCVRVWWPGRRMDCMHVIATCTHNDADRFDDNNRTIKRNTMTNKALRKYIRSTAATKQRNIHREICGRIRFSHSISLIESYVTRTREKEKNMLCVRALCILCCNDRVYAPQFLPGKKYRRRLWDGVCMPNRNRWQSESVLARKINTTKQRNRKRNA